MGLFKSKAEKELDEIIQSIEVNMQNNYKDNAQSAFKELESKYGELKSADSLKTAVAAKYEKIIEDYRERLKGYSHKEQQPYWH